MLLIVIVVLILVQPIVWLNEATVFFAVCPGDSGDNYTSANAVCQDIYNVTGLHATQEKIDEVHERGYDWYINRDLTH